MENKNYEIGDLIMHPKKKQGSQYAIVVDIHKELEGSELRLGFSVKWFDYPNRAYWFFAHDWCETEKGFRLVAKGKQ